MKRFVLALVVAAIASSAQAAFTEFYCQSGGSNLNAGSSTNNSADYTSTGGNWTNSTRVFTPTDSSNPTTSGVSVGNFASVYVTSGATVATFIGRITAVQNATNGTITISSSVSAGTNPSNGTGTITIKVGGAFKGPNGTTFSPLNIFSGTLVDTSSDQARLNIKNDQTYSVTSALSTAASNFVMQGYSSSVGDGGKATFTSSSTGASGGSNFTFSGPAVSLIDLIWVNTGASLASNLVGLTGAGAVCVRNVFHGARANGVQVSSTSLFYECEWYGNNTSNATNGAGLASTNNTAIVVNGYSHDNTFGHGFTGQGNLVLLNSISSNNPQDGILFVTSISGGFVSSIFCDYYNNTTDGINIGNATQQGFSIVSNNNFIKNGGKGINITTTGQSGIVYNNGYGSGTQANGGSDVLKSFIDTGTAVTYASGVTPYVDPTTGNFSINLAAAEGTGRGHFEENDGTHTGTVGYPDIGAAQANIGCPFPTPTSTPTSTPTPTATATASFTPCAATPTATATFTPTSTPTPTATTTPTVPPETSHTFGA